MPGCVGFARAGVLTFSAPGVRAEHPAYFGYPAYTCTCPAETGFSGSRCEFLDECSLNPCQSLTTTAPPAELLAWPSALRATPATDSFLCPAAAMIGITHTPW